VKLYIFIFFIIFSPTINLANIIAASIEETSVQIIEQRVLGADGTLRATKRYYLNPKNEEILHGQQIEFFKNGQKRLETNYQHGKLDGVQIEYHQLEGINSISRIGHWTDNLKSGRWIWFDANGERSSECFYKEDKIVGYKRHWDRGKLSQLEFYDKNDNIVRLESFYPNGRKSKRGKFKNGVKHGAWTYWDNDGNITSKCEWKYGEPWSGKCGLPALGDAGSTAGIEVFKEYRNGQVINSGQGVAH